MLRSWSSVGASCFLCRPQLLTSSLAQAWVTKGEKQLKRVEPKGRARTGIRVHPDSKLTVILKEGKTRVELLEAERQRKLKRIVSAGLKREDVPIRNPGSAWAW